MNDLQTFSMTLVIASIFSFFLSIILAPVVLGWYRRVLLKGMSSWQAGATPFQQQPVPRGKPSSSLTFHTFDTGNLKILPVHASGNRKLTLIYTLGAIVFGLVVAFAFFNMQMEWEGDEVNFNRIWSLTVACALPGVFIAFQRLTGKVWAFFGVVIAVIILHYGVLALAGKYDDSIFIFAMLYTLGLVPLVIFTLLTLRNQRAVTPYLFVLLLGIVPAFFLWLSLNNWLATLIIDRGGSGEEFPLFMVLTGLFFVILYFGASWLTFRWLSARYERKKFSGWMMEADVMMGICVVFFATTLVSAGKLKGALAVVLGFLVYKFVVRLLGWFFFKEKGMSDQGLLFLRVFGRRHEVRQLMQKFTFHWQFHGPVNLIAAPDLASENLEPHELLDLLTGRTKQRFVKTVNDLHVQLSQLDKLPDPDGRYRVNEFFCYNNMWKQVLNSLLPHSRVVMMDLRGFTQKNKGCLYEVGQLFHNVPLRNVLFIVDDKTDVGFLKNNMLTIWGNLVTSSPNANGEGIAQFFHVKNGNKKELDTLKGLVFQMAKAA